MEFKTGQRVELIENDGMAADLGAVATIKGIGSKYVSVIWEKNDLRWNNQGDGGYFPHQFKPLLKKNEQLLFGFMGD